MKLQGILFIFCLLINIVHPLFAQEDLSKDTCSISLLFIGDVMQHSSQIASAFDENSNKYNYDLCFKYIAPIIKGADIAIANLEVTFAGPPYTGYPRFSAPCALADALKKAGVNYVVTANNHSCDRNKKGIERTINVLDSIGIEHTGTFMHKSSRDTVYPLIINKNCFKIALLNYTYGTNDIPVPKPNIVNIIDTTLIGKDLQVAKDSMPDAIIVFMHWGVEYELTPDLKQKLLTEFCFKNGADLVIGSHPHVVQQMERYQYPDTSGKDVFVAYSLGNFVSNQRKRYTDGGAMVEIELKKLSKNSVKAKTTWINNAGYYLTWVYKKDSAGKTDFFILPVSEYRGDTTLITSKTDRDMMDLFANDSRSLFNIYNIQVPEYNYDTLAGSWRISSENVELSTDTFVNTESVIQDTIIIYKIQFFASSNFLDISTLQNDMQDMISTEHNKEGIIRYMLGPFYNYENAKRYLNKLVSDSSFKDAFIVTYKNGRRITFK